MSHIRLWTHHDSRPLRIVVAGGGIAALESAIMLRSLAPEAVSVTVVSPRAKFSWRAERISELFGESEAPSHELSEICAELGASFIEDAVETVRLETREVVLQSGFELEYDALLLAIGARSFPAFETGSTIPFDRGEGVEDWLADLDGGFVQSLAVIVPRGVSWPLPAYELALMASARRPALRVTIVTPEVGPLSLFGPRASTAVGAALAKAGVEFVTAASPRVESASAVRTEAGWIRADRVVSLPVLVGPRIAGIPCDEHGFISVDRRQRVPDSDARVFAAGDGCAGLIKQGGVAAQQATVATAQILELAGSHVGQEVPLAGPVLRAMLNTADGPLFLDADPEDPELTSSATALAPWYGTSKVAAPRLAAYLERRRPAGTSAA